jgi:hypothetical protein
LKDLFALGLKRTITTDDIYDCLSSHQSARVTDQFAQVWEAQEADGGKPSIFRVIRKIYGTRIVGLGLGYGLLDICAR